MLKLKLLLLLLFNHTRKKSLSVFFFALSLDKAIALDIAIALAMAKLHHCYKLDKVPLYPDSSWGVPLGCALGNMVYDRSVWLTR